MAAACQCPQSKEIETLKVQLECVSRERDEAEAANVQSAQYGLELLEETTALRQKCEELQTLYADTSAELQVSQRALAKFQSSLKKTAETSIEYEESILSESAELESSLTVRILELENETTQLRQQVEELTAERDQLALQQMDFDRDSNDRDAERKSLRVALSEIKVRETQLITDYSELEEENITLQKQVSSLKFSQVEFEGAKHEIRRLQEEVEVMNEQLNELTILKKVAEKQLEEALISLQLQREANFALKKAINERIDDETMHRMNYMNGVIGDDTAAASINEELLPITSQLKLEITALRNRLVDVEEEAKEVAILKNKLAETQQRADELDENLQFLGMQAVEAREVLTSTQSNIQVASDEVAELYYLMCSVNQETPSRVFLDYEKHCNGEAEPHAQANEGHLKALECLKGISGLSQKVETLLDQIKLLQTVSSSPMRIKGGETTPLLRSLENVGASDLQEQVNKLQYLLSIKQETIASYRTVLRSNQKVIEKALISLKAKYEKEQKLARETMVKLRNELKSLREGAATFSSLRSMFTARCEEYELEVDNFKSKFTAADRERNTLGQLLSIAVRQKLELSKRLIE